MNKTIFTFKGHLLRCPLILTSYNCYLIRFFSSVSEYYTPKGRRLHKVGVNPDIEVKAIGDGSNQLERAVTELKKRIR